MNAVPGHEAPAWMITWSPAGDRLATASEDGTVRIWRARDGELLHVLASHADGVWSATWSPDGERLVSGGNDGRLCVWEAARGKLVAELEPGGGAIWATGWSPRGDLFAAGSRDGLVRLFDAASARLCGRLAGHGDLVKDLVFSPDGRALASSSDDRTIRVFDLASGESRQVLRGHVHMANTVDWTPDGSALVSCSHDRSVRCWDLESGRERWTIEAHEDDIDAARVSPDGRLVASASHDRTVRLFDIATGARVGVIHGHTDEVEWVSWSPDGSMLATASIDAQGRLFDARSGALRRVLAGRNRAVSTLRANARGEVAVVQDDRTVSVIDPVAGETLLSAADLHEQAIKDAAWSPGGDQLALASLDGSVSVFDVRSAPERVRRIDLPAGAFALDWCRDGSALAIGLADGSVELRDPERGVRIARFHDHGDPVYAVAFRPGSRDFASAARDGLVGLRTGSAFRSLAGHEDMAVSLAWWPRGDRLASGSRDATIRLWDAQGRAHGVLRGHRLTVWGLAVTPDGARLLSSSFDHEVRVWRGDATEHVLAAHRRQVGALAALGPARAISGSREGLCRLWDLDAGTSRLLRPHLLPDRERGRSPKLQEAPGAALQRFDVSKNVPASSGGYAARAGVRAVGRREVSRSEVVASTARKLATLWGAQLRARGSGEALRRHQLRRLRRVLAHAFAEVPLYREKFDAAGVHPSALRSLADLARFPILEKDEMRDAFPDRALARGTQLSRCRIQQTSGSSGRCMEIALSLRCDDARNVYSQRIYGWHGFRWWRSAAYLFPYRLPFENNLGLYRNVWLDAKQPADRVIDELARVRPVVLAATPSDVLELLEGMTPGRDLGGLGLRALCLHSEPVSPDERAHFEALFGCPVRTNYYCNEVWAIAAECEHGRLHEFSDNAVLELLDAEGRPVPDGTPGEVVVTGLDNFVQPFIRYRLGDVAVRSKRQGCLCGRALPVLERIEGRDDDVFVHPDGRRIHPSKITVAAKSPCFAYPGLQVFRDYQIAQTAPDRVVLRVVAGRDRALFAECAKEGVANLERLLAPGVRVDLETPARLPIGAGGKRKIFAREIAQNG
jgi:WD40 repeat protein/phenylacetate-coenzyme A ligase PaaK-like adenylate-forming protein